MGNALARLLGPDSPLAASFLALPIHATVLFKPEDRAFRDCLVAGQPALDRQTAQDVGLFAILPVAPGWRGGEAEPAAPHEAGLTLANRPLILELARRFQVRWSSLPVLVASTDIWHADFVTAATSPVVLERQVDALVRAARLARSRSRPVRTEDIVGTLWSVADGDEVRVRSRPRGSPGLAKQLKWLPEPSADRSERLAGVLQFEAAAGSGPPRGLPPLPPGVEEETAIRREAAHDLRRFIATRRDGAGRDFSPAAVPVRKALESEANLSLAEAVRHARGVPMPKFFGGVHCPGLPRERRKVATGGPRPYDINPRQWKNFGLGDLDHIFATVRTEPTSTLPGILEGVFPDGERLLTSMRLLKEAKTLCNEAVHSGVGTFGPRQIDRLLEQGFDWDLLGPLVLLKRAMRGTRLPPQAA